MTTAAHAGRIGVVRSGLRRLKRERIDLLSALRPKRRLLLVVVVRVAVAVAVGLVVTTDFVLRRGDHMREEKELGSVFVREIGNKCPFGVEDCQRAVPVRQRIQFESWRRTLCPEPRMPFCLEVS